MRDRGYYDRLDKVDGADRDLWQTYMRVPIGEGYTGLNPIRPLQDFRFNEWMPSVHVRAYETDFQTNRWSMRDRDFDRAKPPGTVRIALLGTSQTMGWGVARDATFKALVEARLNREAPPGTRFEILNFAFNGLSPLGQVDVMAKRARLFAPDIVVLVTHLSDLDWVNRDLHRALREKVPVQDGFLRQVLADTRVTARTHEVLAAQRLKPYDAAVAEWSYEHLAEQCREIGALPVSVFLPVPEDLPIRQDAAGRLNDLTERAGFIAIDFSHLFDGRTRAELRLPDAPQNLAPRRAHFNVAAHAIIADALYRQLTTDPRIDLANRARRAAAAAVANRGAGTVLNGGRP